MIGDRLRVAPRPDLRPAAARRPASAPPRSSATSGCTRSATGRSAATRPGMKQRVKLAQALVHDPRLLLLDEPTNGLDPAGRDEMLELIHRTGTEFGIAVIVASHLLGEIERVCDHLVAIEGGKLLRSAPLGSFTERTGTLAVEVEDGHDRARRAAHGGRAAARSSTDRPSCRPRRRAAVRPRPRHDRGARPAAGPDRAAAPSARGPLPRRRRRCAADGEPARRRSRRPAAPAGRLRRDRRMTDAAAPLPTPSPPAGAAAASTTSATAGTRVRGSAGRRRPLARSSTASGPTTGSGAAAGRRSPRSSSARSRSCPRSSSSAC